MKPQFKYRPKPSYEVITDNLFPTSELSKKASSILNQINRLNQQIKREAKKAYWIKKTFEEIK